MVFEYLSRNETRTFPFKDKCTLKATNDYVLANNIFADIILISKRSDITGGYISLITNASGTVTITFTAVSDANNTIVTTLACAITAASMEKHKLFSFSNSSFAVKIVLGSGYTTLSSAPASSTFTAASTLLLEEAVIPMVPRVKSVAFYNGDVLEATVSGSETSEFDLILQEGSNVGFTSETGKMVVQVNPGLGTGLYNGCDDDLVIKTINFIGPDSFQNFLLATDDCYETEKGYQGVPDWVYNYGLTFANTCTPRCTSSQLSSFAHYMNRVRDGMETVAGLATDFNTDLTAAIAAFNADETRNRPVVKFSMAKFSNPYGAPYYSFVVSYFNPTDASIPITGAVPGHEAVPETMRYKQGDYNELLGVLGIVKNLPCHSNGRFEFVLQKTPPVAVQVNASANGITFLHNFALT